MVEVGISLSLKTVEVGKHSSFLERGDEGGNPNLLHWIGMPTSIDLKEAEMPTSTILRTMRLPTSTILKEIRLRTSILLKEMGLTNSTTLKEIEGVV